MPFIFLLFATWLGDTKQIDLKGVGVYSMASNPVYKLGSRFVACDKVESVLLIFSDDKIEKTYKKIGKGPGELHHPFILGIKDNLVYVNTNQGNIIVFDSDLKVIKKDFQKIQTVFSSAKRTSVFLANKNEFMTATMGGQSILHKSTINANGSLVTESFFKRKQLFENSYATINNNHIFITREFFPNESYHIMIFNINPDFSKNMESQIQMELTRDVSSFPQDTWKMSNGSNLLGRAYIIAMVKLNKGYLVELERSKVPGKNDGFIRYRDFFDDTGKFLKREQVKENRYLVPVVNSYDLFVFDEDEEVLIPIKL